MKLLLVFIIGGLLLTACTGGKVPAAIDATQAPGRSVSDLSPAKVPPGTVDAAAQEPAVAEAITVTAAVVEAGTGEAVPKSTVDSTAALPVWPTRKPASAYADLEIVTLLPRDAIPAIDNPRFLSTEEANEFYDPDELVMGVSFNGDSRAYSAPFLSNHEIVNDTVGGVKIAVTW